MGLRICTLMLCAGAWLDAALAPVLAQSAGEIRLPSIDVRAPRSRPARSTATPTHAAAPATTDAPATLSDAPANITRESLSTAAAAQPAASTTISAGTLYRRPYVSYGDIFRALPGFNVANYGQGGIGYGLSMRGYTDAEHGRDIAYFIDGVPVNDVSSLHTPNYADLNILIPETVEKIEVIRGPFAVEFGDSNLGGSVNITTKRSEPFASANASGGSWGTGRAVATYSSTGGAFEPFFVQEGFHSDGYRDNSFVNRYNSFNKLTLPLDDGAALSVRMQAYGTVFGAPSFISRDAVASGALSPRAAVNSTDGRNKYLENLVANYSAGAVGEELAATLFVSHDVLNRYADFGGGQRWQQDERTMVGGRIRKVWTGEIGGTLPAQLLLGGNWRTDFIDAFQAPTVARAVSGPAALNLGIDETNLGGFAQLQVKPLPWVKLTGGGRFDQSFYDVTDRLTPANSTGLSPGIWSPKAGISLAPLAWLELYANYAQGFRSIDAATELIGNAGIQPFKIESKEAGVQLRFERFSLLADAWTTDSQNEAFQPAPGLPEMLLGRTRREGFDLDGRYFIANNARSNISLFANYGAVRAFLLDTAPAFSKLPNVPVYVANVGIDFDVATRDAERLSGSAYVSFIGKKYLTQDGALTTSPFERITARLAYAWPDGWTAFGQATWYPGDRLSEFAINFGDVITASSSDIRTAPQAALTVMAGLTYRIPTVTHVAPPTTKMVVK
jgi:outer membrane receptor protein involved in Fe transport